MRALLAALVVVGPLSTQRWQDICGRSEAGAVALQQAVRDLAADATVLVVASHPDDRYVLPAIWLRFQHGVRIAVLLATRGGGGQNPGGPETGDALERIRTLETEVGCAHFGGQIWYLDRPDAGYRRSAAETFAEWGREGTLRDLVRMIRTIRPDCVITTHHAEESHGHDLALVELLPEAVAHAAQASFLPDVPPHQVGALLLGAGSTDSPSTVRVDADSLEPVRGRSLRRLAYEVLLHAHVSPGPPAPIDVLFEPELRLEAHMAARPSRHAPQGLGLRSVFDADLWPGEAERAPVLERLLAAELPRRVARSEAPLQLAAEILAELRALAAGLHATDPNARDARERLDRRVAALERLALVLAGVQVELDVPPGVAAVAGEEFVAVVRVHAPPDQRVGLRVEGLDAVAAELDPVGEGDPDHGIFRNGSRAQLVLRLPLRDRTEADPMARRFRGDRFEPPVRVRFHVQLDQLAVPLELTVPVEERAPVELSVVPRMLLLPTARRDLQFSVGVTRYSRFPIDGEIELRAPAGYGIESERRPVALREVAGDMFGFHVTAARERKPGVDVLRIRLGGNRIALPVHNVDVQVPPELRVGLLRSLDDTLPAILGAGGLGLAWSDLSDADIAVADLRAFDTIVVDVRALRDRPAARRGFRRLLDFATGAGRRLVLFYQKDTEFHPPGEGFLGAPFQPFQVGRARVTRSDAPVRVLRPEHTLLTHPNRIVPGDWDGWEQERALYLPSRHAGAYEELLELHDPGQPPERGALLYARTGDGEYVYCALALWRQLKKLHPGAVRLLANLLTPARPR
ncbi:MAG: PIG-L family deacetylase [Planctomycetes bacterium]|nr:PIG-L family deacetylase [Planctomycetota bacterium]